MNTKPRILVIDDESAIREMLSVNLQANGFEVHLAESGQRGLEQTNMQHPHLIILDLGLPDLPGFEVLAKLRAWTEIPVIVLTVNDDEATKVSLLDAGADDYLTKPFSSPELLARIRAGLRRNRLAEATPIFKSEDLTIDVSQNFVQVRDQHVKLTATEFALLSRLVRASGRVVTQRELLHDIWGPHSIEQTQYLRIYVGLLRKKIEVSPSSPRHLLTEPGVGYRLI